MTAGTQGRGWITAHVDTILEATHDGFLALDHELRFVHLNERAARAVGRAPADLIGRLVWEAFPAVTGQPLHDLFRRALAEGRPQSLEGWFPPLRRWVLTRAVPVPEGLLVFLRDVTAARTAEFERERVERRYHALSHDLNSVVWQASPEGELTYIAAWEALTGHEDHDEELPYLPGLIHPDDLPGTMAAWERSVDRAEPFDVTYRLRHAHGRWVPVRARGVPLVNRGQVEEWVGVLVDLSEQVAAEGALRRAALEDPLTGLPNRDVFLERLSTIVARRDPRTTVLFVDIDRFKAINDRFGHARGDSVLRAVGRRLRRAVRPSYVVCRLSGDEFAVICDDLGDEAQARSLAARVQDALAAPLEEDNRIQVSASIGLSLVRVDDDDAEVVLRAADAAMYRVKERGGAAVSVFDDDLREQLLERSVVEAELRAGLEDEAVHLAYQPIVPLTPARPPTAEALLRWRRSDGRPIAADQAISVAEETGLIGRIGRVVLERACRCGAAWLDAGADLGVAVNVSPRQIARSDELVRDVDAALRETGLPAGRLTLEITETVLMEDMRQGERVLNRLRELGVQLEIDDFGVGYSSLSYLHRLPVQAVKLDRTFIAGLPGDPASVRILEAVVGLGRAFDIGVIAEGVETTAQLATVRAAGCHAVQGFVLARPVPHDELPGRLAAALATVA